MSATATITPEFPYSPASEGRRHLGSLLSSSHFVTTVVSPPALGPPPQRRPAGPQPLDPQDNADPTHTPPLQADSSSADVSTGPSESPQPPAGPSVPIETARLHAPAHAESRPVGIRAARLKSSNPRQTPSPAYSLQQFPVLVGTGRGCVTWPSPRRRSAWRRFKRMGSSLVTPLRSLGLCFTSSSGGRRAMTFCEDLSAEASPGSSWYSSGEYPPEYIRTVLENNALLGKLAA